jgi:hypothetical protein
MCLCVLKCCEAIGWDMVSHRWVEDPWECQTQGSLDCSDSFLAAELSPPCTQPLLRKNALGRKGWPMNSWQACYRWVRSSFFQIIIPSADLGYVAFHVLQPHNQIQSLNISGFLDIWYWEGLPIKCPCMSTLPAFSVLPQDLLSRLVSMRV